MTNNYSIRQPAHGFVYKIPVRTVTLDAESVWTPGQFNRILTSPSWPDWAVKCRGVIPA